MKSPITLILGATPNADRYSFMATALLVEKGHAVYPFGIKKGEILTTPIINEWPTTESIDTVTLYLGPAAQEAYYNAILDLKPRRIIFNPGTENPILNQLAIQKGIETIDACTLVMLKTGQY
ncbi:MAG: CoA-binding protein [Chitinophagaceae bacterium]|nr:CoA-binding protein [Chitinophagaceae bacterium]